MDAQFSTPQLERWHMSTLVRIMTIWITTCNWTYKPHKWYEIFRCTECGVYLGFELLLFSLKVCQDKLYEIFGCITCGVGLGTYFIHLLLYIHRKSTTSACSIPHASLGFNSTNQKNKQTNNMISVHKQWYELYIDLSFVLLFLILPWFLPVECFNVNPCFPFLSIDIASTLYIEFSVAFSYHGVPSGLTCYCSFVVCVSM